MGATSLRGWAKSGAERGFGFAGAVIGVHTDEPVAALTFDDGPCRSSTPAVLEALARHDTKATFFLLGERARHAPEMVKQVVAGGHAVGAHGWQHDSLVADAPTSARERGRWRADQLQRGVDALDGRGSGLYRPPFGHSTLPARVQAARRGQRMIMWTFSAKDWTDATPSQIADRILGRLQPGSIVLLHDAKYDECAPRPSVAEAVDQVLQATAGRYEWLTIPALLERAPARVGFRFGSAASAPARPRRADPCLAE